MIVSYAPDGVPVQRCTVHKHRNLFAHAPERLHDEITADYSDMIYAKVRLTGAQSKQCDAKNAQHRNTVDGRKRRRGKPACRAVFSMIGDRRISPLSQS